MSGAAASVELRSGRPLSNLHLKLYTAKLDVEDFTAAVKSGYV